MVSNRWLVGLRFDFDETGRFAISCSNARMLSCSHNMTLSCSHAHARAGVATWTRSWPFINDPRTLNHSILNLLIPRWRGEIDLILIRGCVFPRSAYLCSSYRVQGTGFPITCAVQYCVYQILCNFRPFASFWKKKWFFKKILCAISGFFGVKLRNWLLDASTHLISRTSAF